MLLPWCVLLQDSRSTGLTLGLLDLRLVDSSLDTAMAALATTLVQQMGSTPGASRAGQG